MEDNEPFYCCVTANNEERCEEQCQSCIDWVEDAKEQNLADKG